MAEQKTNAGGVEITVGEKSTGQKMAEATPFYGGYLKTREAAGKFSDGADGSEVTGLASEGAALLGSLGTSALGVATDPIGWLVGQGLNFLISVVQPLEDAIHFVSGDGPALQQAAENFNNIAKGVADMRAKFDEDLQSAVPSFGASTAAAGAATGVRVATTGSRVARIVAKLRQFLDKIMAFLRNLAGRVKNVRTAFQKSMADKKTNSALADVTKAISKKDPERGFPGSMGKAAIDAVRGQLGVGTGANAGIDKPLRNVGSYQKANEYDDTGKDQQKYRIEGDLDL